MSSAATPRPGTRARMPYAVSGDMTRGPVAGRRCPTPRSRGRRRARPWSVTACTSSAGATTRRRRCRVWRSLTSTPDGGRSVRRWRTPVSILPRWRPAVRSGRWAAASSESATPMWSAIGRALRHGSRCRRCRWRGQAFRRCRWAKQSSSLAARTALQTVPEVDRLDMRTGRWTPLAELPVARHGLGVVADGPLVFAIDGGPQPGLTTSRLVTRLRVP